MSTVESPAGVAGSDGDLPMEMPALQPDARAASTQAAARSRDEMPRWWLLAAWNWFWTLLRTRFHGGRWSALGAMDSSEGTLDEVIEDLRNLNQHTESDFLGIGAKLMEFRRTAESISSGLNSVTVLISGEHGHRASGILEGALERCREMEERAVERSRTLGSLHDGAAVVSKTFSGFQEFEATFRVLCTLTRIETARLGGAERDFGALTEDVESLAVSMGSKVESVLEAAIVLDQRVEHSVVNLADVDFLLSDLSQVIAGVMGSLAAFTQQQTEALALSARLVSECNSASSSIQDLVTSIQFHDITRQQVEHVVEVLERIASERRGASRTRETTAVLTLQASQLADAEEKFNASVGRLSRDLENIAACVREMARNGRSLNVSGDSSGDSFFLKMEQCLQVILNAAGSFDLAKEATRVAAGELSTTLGQMQTAAVEVREIDLQLLRVALNACLRASHIGDKGLTLSVLAGDLQSLAMRARGRSHIAGETLESMRASLNRLSEADEPANAKVGADEDVVAEQMRSTIAELHSWTETSFARIMEVTSLASRLCDDISSVESNFAAGRLFSEVVTRCREKLSRLGSEGTPASPGESAASLQDLASRYTMQAERDVHAAMTGGIESCEWQAAPVVGSVPAEIEGLGDNVELF